MHPFLEHDGPIPMVHRGAPLGREVEVVENTRAAFRRAYQLGFRYFETDVRTTRDGVLVACHDHSLRRVAGERVQIADVTWDELADTPVGDEPLPRLVDLLEEYPDVSFNIDPKVDEAVRPLVTVLLDMSVLSRSCVASFSDRRLWWVRTALPERVCTAAGPRELVKASTQAARGQPLDLPGVDVLQIPRFLARRSPAPLRWQREWRADLVAAAQRVGLPVHVWTVNDGAEMERLLGRGVDGVMSDDTKVLASVFAAHGWQPRN
jgi:glycerophosphoryl diester phosphodiesterase